MDNMRWLMLGGIAAVVAGVFLIPTLTLVFVILVRTVPLLLLVVGIVLAAYLIFRRPRRDDEDAEVPPPDRTPPRDISTERGVVRIPDYPSDLPWWDEQTRD
jgi:hypothetical protein